MVSAGVFMVIGAGAFRAPRRDISGLNELAHTHARRHKQRPTRQQENQCSEPSVTQGIGTPLAKSS
jgi:hypothetical protein